MAPSKGIEGLAASGDARTKTLRTAYLLFSQHGVQAIGIDRIVHESGVAKTTLYRHFPSKDALVMAVLALREALWTEGWLESEVNRRASSSGERLIAIFDLFDEWFQRDDYEGCLFTSMLLETYGVNADLTAECVARRANIRRFLKRLAEEAGVRDPDQRARQWQMLMTGAIVAAQEGDRAAATRARELAQDLLDKATRAG